MNRRKFLSNSGKQIALLNVLGLASSRAIAGKSESDRTPGKDNFIYRELGKTGIRLPIVSMGVMNANNPNLLKAAWSSGIRHFDTAWFYQNGNNERMVGSVLKEVGAKREEVTIATKIFMSGPPIASGKERKEVFLKRFNESLDRLKMEYVDILYYHAVDSLQQTNDPYIMEAFTELKADKKIRFSGFSIHTYWPDIVKDAASRKFYDVILLSYNYGMYQDTVISDAIKQAYDAGIGLIAMKTQCQQDWYKQELPADQQKFYNERNMNTALLKWALRNKYITTAIPGFTTFDQLEEDMKVISNTDFTMEEEDFFRSRNINLAIQSVCTHCGQCSGTCSRGVDIPSLMRVHMYSLSYGNPLHASLTLNTIEQGRGLEKCGECSVCTAKCRSRVPVARRISELKELYC